MYFRGMGAGALFPFILGGGEQERENQTQAGRHRNHAVAKPWLGTLLLGIGISLITNIRISNPFIKTLSMIFENVQVARIRHEDIRTVSTGDIRDSHGLAAHEELRA